jgi:hypothetical protein
MADPIDAGSNARSSERFRLWGKGEYVRQCKRETKAT